MPGNTALSRLKFLDQMLEAARPAVYAFLFLVLASVQCVVIALILPPFQGADEANHSKRADAISRGQFTGLRVTGGQYGGLVDPAIGRANEMSSYLQFNREQPIRPDTDAATRAVRWTGTAEPQVFGNTVVGSPAMYLPSVAGVALGRQLGLPVVASFKIGRLLNAAVYVAIGAAAIALAGSAAPFLFVVLTLPMSAFVASYVTQDGPILAAAALGVVLILNAMTREANLRSAGGASRFQLAAFAGAAVAMLLAALGKSPYLVLILLLFCATAIPIRLRLGAAAIALAMALGWHIHAARLGIRWPGDPSAQLAWLAANPFAVFGVAAETLRSNWQAYQQQLVGNFGWLDAPVPGWFVNFALAALGFSLAAIAFGRVFLRNDIVKGVKPELPALALLLGCGAIFASLYAIWSPVGDRMVHGVQGRYFLPLLPMLALVLASIGRSPDGRRRPSRFWRPLPELAILLPYAVATPCVTIYTLVDRYYR